MTVAPRAWSQADSGTQALRVGSRMTVTEASSGILAHRRSRSAVVVRNFHDDQMNSPRSSARLARWSARQATSMPNLTSFMACPFAGRLISRLFVVDRCTFRRGMTIQTFRSRGPIPDRPPSSRKGMHVRREARLVDDHLVESSSCSLQTPIKSSQKNRPDAPYEGLPPNRWMPRTNAKYPRTPERWGASARLGYLWRQFDDGVRSTEGRTVTLHCGGKRVAQRKSKKVRCWVWHQDLESRSGPLLRARLGQSRARVPRWPAG